MSGYIARTGFQFQDRYLLLRVLRAAAKCLDVEWSHGGNDALKALAALPLRFGLEASPQHDGVGQSEDMLTLDWDVLVSDQKRLEFAEVKSGIISKQDRLSFWRRLRRELTRTDTSAPNVVPALVVDPSTAGELTKWQALASTAAAFVGQAPKAEPNRNVTTARQLFEEALWSLCCPGSSTDGSEPAVDLNIAKAALSAFELHCHKSGELEAEVEQYLETLFPGGLTDTQHSLLLGWLSRRATASSPRKLFTVRELLAEIGILEEALTLTPGTLKEWRHLWDEIPQAVRLRTRVQLGETGAAIDAIQVQPVAVQALVHAQDRGLLVLGPGGAGKSTFVQQAAMAAEQRGDVVLHCGADDVDAQELEHLIKSFRFRAAMSALTNPAAQLLFTVDGLDEADAPLRKRWAQLLSRLIALPNVRITVSVRDEIWNHDGKVRSQLQRWAIVQLTQWPEKLVRDLVAPTPFGGILHVQVIELLRTPILLDLFWRTFVEGDLTNTSGVSRLQTRHNLLSAFWHERLLHSPRHAALGGKAAQLASVFALAAVSVEAFPESGLDADVIQMLVSEGVLVREGRLQLHLRFRHPFLRDFALSQWCLSGGSASEAARRCLSIKSGLQRHGAIRAIFEALSDTNAKTDYPGLTLVRFVETIVLNNASAAKQIAQVLGTRDHAPGLDPATWPLEAQRSLPVEFGRDLIVAARLVGNGTWATRLESWPDEAGWLDNDFPHEVWRYASALRDKSKSNSDDIPLGEQCRQATRKLRSLSEADRFQPRFVVSDRWLKMQALRCIIPVLADYQTLEWVEREMTQASWRTRLFLLEQLIHLAGVDVKRSARIYRDAVGLSKLDGEPVLDASIWSAVRDHQAFDCSLAGDESHRSLLREYPLEFLPVALDLAAALWRGEHKAKEDATAEIDEWMKQVEPSWPDRVDAQEKRAKDARLADLIDDNPEWSFWRSLPHNGGYEHCLRAIRDCAEDQAKRFPAFFLSGLVPILKSSRLATVHSIVVDVLLGHSQELGFVDVLADCLLDARLYHVAGLRYWIEQGIIVAWHALEPPDRTKVLANIASLRESHHLNGEDYAGQLLARVPTGDLPDGLLELRPADGDPEYRPYLRPESSAAEIGGEWTPLRNSDEEDNVDKNIGEWPVVFDREALKILYRTNETPSTKGAPEEKLKEQITLGLQAALVVVQELRSHSKLLQERGRFWIWRALRRVLDDYRHVYGKDSETQPPPESLVRDCAEIALTVIAHGPGKLEGELPENDWWTGRPESGWTHALSLADAALTWPPAKDDRTTQQRFEEALETAFGSGHVLEQLVCTTTIRPWHWFRSAERRQLHDKLIWRTPKHASVLAWSLKRTENYHDKERAGIYRLLLNRGDVDNPKELAQRIGRDIGVLSMHVFLDAGRSALAEVAREAIDIPQAFSLFENAQCRGEFLRNFVFGMKQQAQKMSDHTELAADFGAWNLKAWRELRPQRKKRRESENVVLHAMHWLERKEENKADRMKLKIWWQHIHPLLKCVVDEGGRPDCFTLFFNLRNGDYNDLSTPEELMELVDLFAQRLVAGATKNWNLDERKPEQHEHESWRECAEYAAELIGSLHKDGSLQNDLHREQAHSLLSRLSADPIRSSHAVEALHRLQNL